jgi:hypothetical protein
MDARRRGVDPDTGQKLRTHASREGLRKYLSEESGRLENTFRILIETYENSFGSEAADAFKKCVRARHADIPVEAERRREIFGDLPDPPKPHRVTLRGKRTCTVLPVPRPLPAAIAAGHFGLEDGKPVNPKPAEVRAITEDHAERIINWIHGRQEELVKEALDKYAESFGQAASERLAAHTRRQVQLGDNRHRYGCQEYDARIEQSRSQFAANLLAALTESGDPFQCSFERPGIFTDFHQVDAQLIESGGLLRHRAGQASSRSNAVA